MKKLDDKHVEALWVAKNDLSNYGLLKFLYAMRDEAIHIEAREKIVEFHRKLSKDRIIRGQNVPWEYDVVKIKEFLGIMFKGEEKED